MTLKDITNLLEQQGINSKGQVLKSLKDASLDELRELRQSITEEIIVKEKQ